MSSYTDRAFDDALEMGRRNQDIIELARRHCLNMQFQQSGGQGMAEEASGLPINTRRVHCPFGKPANSMAMNLEWIAVDFYEENCEGCPHRRPTGELPSLATVVEERREAAKRAQADSEAADASERAAWELREQQRQAMRSTATPPMSSAIADIGMIDHDPATSDLDSVDAARRRLEALADRGSEFFTDQVIGHIIALIREGRQTALLGTLRRLALRVESHRRALVDLALGILEEQPNVEAASCLVDYRDELVPGDLGESVVRSLVLLAGRPERNDFGHRRRRATSNDPAGLSVAADLCPDKVEAVLRDLLRARPANGIDLQLPLGVRAANEDGPPTDFERCAAAGAIRSLAVTKPELAVSMIDALVDNLRADENDRFGLRPVGDVQRTLAVLFISELGDVLHHLEAAAARAGEEYRDRLFGVFERSRRLVYSKDRWREPHDPDLDEHQRAAALRRIVASAFARISGDWGEEVSWHAAALLEDLAQDDAANMVDDIATILGAFLESVEKLDATPGASDLTIASAQTPQIAALELLSQRHRTTSAAGRLLDTLEHIAKVDCMAVLTAVIDVITEVKDTPSQDEVTWRLIPLVGKLGRAHGSKPEVLRRGLPILHTYLVHSDQSLRARAIEAWAEIGGKHHLPSSLADLLPALTTDAYLVVIEAVLKAARRLSWSDPDRIQLFSHAMTVASGAPSAGLLKEALYTLLALTRKDDARREGTEAYALEMATALDGYDLRDVLRREWLPISSRLPAMAALRLTQARDPRINDRWNAGDDEELTALLSCGPGIVGLSLDELLDAALELNPEYPVQGAEFVEVAWRAGRPKDGLEILLAMRARLPDQPVYSEPISFLESLKAAIELDARRESESLEDALTRAGNAASTLVASAEEPADFRGRLGRQLSARVRATGLMAGVRLPEGLPPTGPEDGFDAREVNAALSAADPAAWLKVRADALVSTATAVEKNAQRFTSTATYVRHFASLCVIAAHLLYSSAAELDARGDDHKSHRTAANRRADELLDRMRLDFAEDDPLAGPVLSSLDGLEENQNDAERVVPEWAKLAVPLQIVDGPRARRSPARSSAEAVPADETPVVVAVASIDDLLVTGTQVLRSDTVYTLGVEVRGEGWPEWAERLDAEILSHLTQAEAQTPTFTWRRPANVNSDEAFVLEGEATLLLRFGLAAGRPAPLFLVSMRFRGVKDSPSSKCATSPDTLNCDLDRSITRAMG